MTQTQLHVPFESRLYQRLRVAVNELGYGTIVGWCRSMAMSTIREWEEMKAKAEKWMKNQKALEIEEEQAFSESARCERCGSLLNETSWDSEDDKEQ